MRFRVSLYLLVVSILVIPASNHPSIAMNNQDFLLEKIISIEPETLRDELSWQYGFIEILNDTALEYYSSSGNGSESNPL